MERRGGASLTICDLKIKVQQKIPTKQLTRYILNIIQNSKFN